MTYSIVARDPETGELGVAVQSHWFAAADLVMWAEPGVGTVATQALVEVSHGPLGLELMREGATAEEAVRVRAAADHGRENRQFAMVDARGRAAAYTGERCIREAGHRTGDGFSVQANMMLHNTVWDAMASAFEASAARDLTHRLLDALDAAEAQGGDVRGRQAAGILVVRATPGERSWEDIVVHLRVDDHPDPLPELRRLVELKLAYDRLDAAEKLEEAGDAGAAYEERGAAMRAFPRNAEIAFWSAVSLAERGDVDEACRTIGIAFRTHPGWEELLRRLARDGFLGVPTQTLERLLASVAAG